jgi:cyclophilin family peptidyl-prolyl cis-trans isomerase
VLVQSPVPVEPAATMAPVPALAEASSGVPQTMQSGGAEQPSRPVQDNKGRCFTCKGKIAMAKQAPNTCKCGTFLQGSRPFICL